MSADQGAKFAIGRYWIDREPGRDSWYYYWLEPGTRRVRRRSLGTADFERAKVELAAKVILETTDQGDPLITTVLAKYCQEVTDKKPSKGFTLIAKKTLLAEFGEKTRVSALTEKRQHEAIDNFAAKRHSAPYIARNMGVLAAALKHGRVQNAPRILYNQSTIAERINAGEPGRRWIPTDKELARFLDHFERNEATFRWLIIAMSTACRPEAGLDLAPQQRIADAGIVDLNTPGRRQNKKHRPTLREPAVLTAWLDHWKVVNADGEEVDKACPYVQLSKVDSLQTAFHRRRKDAKLPLMTPYSIRHKVTSVLRKAGISEDQIAVQLGHKRPHLRTTAGYGEFAPDYLFDASAAIDAWLHGLSRLCKKPLFAPVALTKLPQTNVVPISFGKGKRASD